MPALRERFGWSVQVTDHLLHRYGSLVEQLLERIAEDASLGRPLEHAPAYLRVEVAYACISEGVLHLEDVMMRRTRLYYEAPRKGLLAVPEIAEIAVQWLGWDEEQEAAEVAAYERRVLADEAAAREPDDASAVAARDRVLAGEVESR